jgi:hypothetical protein
MAFSAAIAAALQMLNAVLLVLFFIFEYALLAGHVQVALACRYASVILVALYPLVGGAAWALFKLRRLA